MGHLKWAVDGLDLIDVGSVIGAQWVVADPPEDAAALRFWAVSDQDPTEDGRPLDFASSWYEMPADGNDNT